METLNVRIRVPTADTEVKIVCMGCVHHGAAGCDEKLADFWYSRILASPNTYAVFGGDMVDGIYEKDKRYMEEEVAPWCFGNKWGGTLIDRQYNYALAKWARLAAAGKILWINTGNHEMSLKRYASRDLTLDWARALKVPYAGYSALGNLVVEFGSEKHSGGAYKSYRVPFYSTHGAGKAQTAGSVINSAKKMLASYDVNLALMWHLHRKMHVPVSCVGVTEPHVHERPRLKVVNRVAAICGTFLRQHVEGVTSYGEVKGHEPAPLGPIVVHTKFEEGPHPGLDTPDGAKTKLRYIRLWVSDALVL